MKKSLLSMLAVAAGLLMATSCSNEREEVQTEGEAVVSFVAELPHSMVNRAPQKAADATTFGDGTTATNLNYAVYKVGDDGAWTEISDLSGNKTINLQTTVALKLVNGNKYAVAFWADAPSSIYTFDKATCTVTANYTDVASSNESLDAFFAVKEFTVNGTSQETIELYRPFAQLNIGTGDLADSKAAGQEILEAGVTVKTYNTLSLKDGAVSGEAEVTFAKATLPTVAFPVTGYSYLTMNYLLMSADKAADNTVTISYDNANVPDRVFNNVPLQRNYRTNIYGNLLTSTTEFNVIIKPEFDGTVGLFPFSVAEGRMVLFSKGNLQYIQSTATWSFAEHQYDVIGASNLKADKTLADTIDLFGWSTNSETVQWGISTSRVASEYEGDFVDWGKNIGDGNTYRTLTQKEWWYVVNLRDNASSLMGVARINLNEDGSEYVNGLILLPDAWVCPAGVTFKSGFGTVASILPAALKQAYADFQTLTLYQWQQMEDAGAIFLPAAGYRYGTRTPSELLAYGGYWAASRSMPTLGADYWYFYPHENNVNYKQLFYGLAVRLVQEL